MIYNIKRNIELERLELYEDDILKSELVDETLKLSFISKGKRFVIEEGNLEDFFKRLDNLTDLSNASVTILKDNVEFNVSILDLRFAQRLNKIYFNISYEKEFKVSRAGFLDYSYTNYYMPKWSTAYMFDHSSHVKTVEPLFTDLSLNSIFIERLVGCDPTLDNIVDKEDLITNQNYMKSIKEIGISEKTKEGLIDVVYNLNSKIKLSFNFSKTVYIKRTNPYTLNLRLFGMSNNTFISEDIKLETDGIVKLKLEYDYIYDIQVVDFAETVEFDINLEDINVRISNSFNILGDFLNYEVRKNNSIFKLEGDNLLYKTGYNNTKVLNLGSFDNESHLYVDAKDNVYKLFNSILSVGRLDSKLDLQIPKDMTYNNTKYIETTYLTSTEYLVEILVLDYFRDTQKNKISIALKNSLGEIYYLNRNSQLELSDSEIFIDASEVKREKITFELNINSDIEFIIITLNDFDGHYKKSNIIIHPKVIFTDITTLNPSDTLVLLEDKVSIIDTETLTLRESLNV